MFTIAIPPNLSDAASKTGKIPIIVGHQGDQHDIPGWDED